MEKRFIPVTKPRWNRELPTEDANSLVDAAGNNYDNGYNFDERLDDDDIAELERQRFAKRNLANAALTATELKKELEDEDEEENMLNKAS